MLRCIILIVVFAISGCASQHELAVCKGPPVALNASHWQPTSGDMATFDKMCAAKEPS